MSPPANQPPAPPPKRPAPRPGSLPRITREEGPDAPPEAPAGTPPAPYKSEDGDAILAERGVIPRSHSPAGGIRIESKWGRITMPHVALVAILASFGGAGVATKVASDSGGDRAEMMAELRSIRDELKGLRSDVREVRDEQASGRSDDKKIVSYVEGSLTPIVASLRKLGVKLEYAGRDRASGVEFHQPPLGGAAPQVQPMAVLPERPSL